MRSVGSPVNISYPHSPQRYGAMPAQVCVEAGSCVYFLVSITLSNGCFGLWNFVVTFVRFDFKNNFSLNQ